MEWLWCIVMHRCFEMTVMMMNRGANRLAKFFGKCFPETRCGKSCLIRFCIIHCMFCISIFHVSLQQARWITTSIRPRKHDKELYQKKTTHLTDSNFSNRLLFSDSYKLLCVISERELKFMFAICHRRSVCLSVCRLSYVCNVGAPYSGDWNFRQCFYAVGYLGLLLTSR